MFSFRFVLSFFFTGSLYANGIPSETTSSKFGKVYIPGDYIESFSVPLTNGDTLSYNINDDFESNVYFPLVIWVTNFNYDSWSKSALLSETSIDAFLESDIDLGKCHYLFIGGCIVNDNGHIINDTIIDTTTKTTT